MITLQQTKDMEYNIASLIAENITLLPKGTSKYLFLDYDGNEEFNFDDWNKINDFIIKLIMDPFADMIAGRQYTLPQGMTEEREAVEIKKLGEDVADELIIRLADIIAKNKEATQYKMFMDEVENLFEMAIIKGGPIPLKGKSSGQYGTFIEQSLFGIPKSQTDPRADVGALKMDIKTTESGPVSVGGAGFEMDISKFLGELPNSEKIGKPKSLQDINIFITSLLVSVYKLLIKMRNLMLLSYKKIGTSSKGYPYIKFLSIDLFVALIAKRVWDEVFKELQKEAGLSKQGSDKIEVSFEKTRAYTHGEHSVNLKLKYRGGGGQWIDKPIKRGFKRYPWEKLYATRVDLLDKMRVSNDIFRAAVFTVIRNDDDWVPM